MLSCIEYSIFRLTGSVASCLVLLLIGSILDGENGPEDKVVSTIEELKNLTFLFLFVQLTLRF